MANGRVWRSRSLDLALVLLGVVSLVLVFVVVALTVDSGNGPLWALLLVNAVAVEYLVVGLLGWRRRPHNRLGPIIVVGAIAILLSALGNVATPSLVAVGIVFATLPLGMIVHLLLAFPSGRLQTRSSVVIVVAAYVVCLVLQAPLYLFAADGPVPGDPLAIADRPDLAGSGRRCSRCAAPSSWWPRPLSSSVGYVRPPRDSVESWRPSTHTASLRFSAYPSAASCAAP